MIKRFFLPPLLFLLAVLFLAGCASSGAKSKKVYPTVLQVAVDEYGDDELLDVGITVFDKGDIDAKDLKDQHTNERIRESEAYFFPVHLKSTLEKSGYWGAVRVIPDHSQGLDVYVEGHILESNGEKLKVKVFVEDSTGKTWFTRIYRSDIEKEEYAKARMGEFDPFQRIYNSIANDMAAYRRTMTDAEITTLRRTSDLIFASQMAPDTFKDYLKKDESGSYEVLRYPADDDPMWERVKKVESRQDSFLDTLNAHYEPYYQDMWKAYLDWRKFNLVEQKALRKAKSDGWKRAAIGVAMIAAAIALEANDVDNTRSLQNILVLGGGQVVISGVNVSKQAEMHSVALQEMNDSFGSQVRTLVVEIEGEVVELTGTTDEKMEQWREILQKIYAAENEIPEEETLGEGGKDLKDMESAGSSDMLDAAPQPAL